MMLHITKNGDKIDLFFVSEEAYLLTTDVKLRDT